MSNPTAPQSSPFDTLRITCAPGLGPYLAEEIESLGHTVDSVDHTGVRLAGTINDAMNFNLRLRTALHVMQTVASFRCTDADALYRQVNSMPWEELIPTSEYITVVSAVNTPSIDNTMFANLKVKDAIVDRITQHCGRRPDSGPLRDHVVIHLFWKDSEAEISIDTSGEKLADRGYRRRPHKAPMQEALAAATLLAARYDGSCPLVLPMCGSGTLAIEAALIATQRAPGLLRDNYAFMHLRSFDKDAWGQLRRDALGSNRKKRLTPEAIIATDNDPDAIEAARANATTAGVQHLIRFDVCDFADTDIPEAGDAGGIILMNPEYGERMGDVAQLEETYGRIGDFMKQRCQGYRGYIFTGNADLAGKIGLRTSRRMTFWNAKIECRLLEYELYGGTRKKKGVVADAGGDSDE